MKIPQSKFTEVHQLTFVARGRPQYCRLPHHLLDYVRSVLCFAANGSRIVETLLTDLCPDGLLGVLERERCAVASLRVGKRLVPQVQP
jgi:hypothetical protein